MLGDDILMASISAIAGTTGTTPNGCSTGSPTATSISPRRRCSTTICRPCAARRDEPDPHLRRGAAATRWEVREWIERGKVPSSSPISAVAAGSPRSAASPTCASSMACRSSRMAGRPASRPRWGGISRRPVPPRRCSNISRRPSSTARSAASWFARAEIVDGECRCPTARPRHRAERGGGGAYRAEPS